MLDWPKERTYKQHSKASAVTNVIKSKIQLYPKLHEYKIIKQETIANCTHKKAVASITKYLNPKMEVYARLELRGKEKNMNMPMESDDAAYVKQPVNQLISIKVI